MTATSTLQHVNRLQQLYQAGFEDPFLDTALEKIIQHQVQRDEADLQEVEAVLKAFEDEYGLNSQDFWEQYQAGQLADSVDFMEWNVYCQTQQRIRNRLDILRISA